MVMVILSRLHFGDFARRLWLFALPQNHTAVIAAKKLVMIDVGIF
jgi:hypothetical protein